MQPFTCLHGSFWLLVCCSLQGVQRVKAVGAWKFCYVQLNAICTTTPAIQSCTLFAIHPLPSHVLSPLTPLPPPAPSQVRDLLRSQVIEMVLSTDMKQVGQCVEGL